MPHGQPDFGMYAIAETIYRLSDMAELAVRLGSIDTFDRRGNVVWLDDFEDNLSKWNIVSLGTGAGAALSTDGCRNGAKSVKLTTGNAQNDYICITHYSPRPVLSKIGFEISFTTDEDLNAHFFYIIYYDGTNRHQALICYNPTTDKLYYYNENGAAQELASNLNLYAYSTHYHTLKLVVDLETDKYVRLLLDETEYDLSSYLIQESASATLPRLEVQYLVRTNVASSESVYAEDAIITQNEP